MKVQAKITAIRRLLTEIEILTALTEKPVAPIISNTNKIYAIIKECQPIHKRAITRKTYSIPHKERDNILAELCFKNKIVCVKVGKKVTFAINEPYVNPS